MIPSINNNEETKYLYKIFPTYIYLGNILTQEQCVQRIREKERKYGSDNFCFDYSLLYTINRINEMIHEEP